MLAKVVYCDQFLGTIEKIDKSTLKCNINDIKELGVAKLLFKDSEGDFRPSNERYIVSYNGNYPIIEAKISGHSVTLDIKDIDGDEEVELLGYYFAGGNQYALKLFEFSESGLIPFISQPISSNIRSIEIRNEKIFVKNISLDEKGKQMETLTIYSVENYRVLKAKAKSGTPQ